jgi:hypothetical protein
MCGGSRQEKRGLLNQMIDDYGSNQSDSEMQ